MAKSWLDSVKGVFVEYKEVPDKPGEEATPAVSAPAPSPAGPKATPSTTSVADPALVKTLDDSAKKQLVDAIEASGAELVDDLSDIIDTLKESIPDEAALYKAALKMLGKKGHTSIAILGDYDKCIGAIETKNREFDAQLQGQFQKRVGSKQQAIQTLNGEIASIKAQIEQLQTQMAEKAVQAQETQGEITEEQQKLDLAHKRFEAVYKAVRAEVESQRAKVTQYGGKV